MGLVVGAEGFESCLKFGNLFLLFLDEILVLTHSLAQSLFLLGVVALNSHTVLVKLVLSQQVSTDALVKSLNLALLMANLLILTVVDLKHLLQLEL